MSRKRKCLTVLALLLAAVVLMGCGSWDELFGQESPAPRSTVPEGVKTVGSDSALVGTPIKLHAVPGRGSAEPWPPASLRWTVEPSDGAVVSPGGNFKASKPGVYRVTATLTNGSNENDHIFITVTSPDNAFAGTYKGTIAAVDLTVGGRVVRRADLPCEFAVDGQASLTGRSDYSWDYHGLRTAIRLSGQVSDDGRFDASGKITAGGTSAAISLSGRISGTTLSGKFSGGGNRVTAERQ